MAISKTQNERPAISSLIDTANALEVASNTHAGDIETLTDGLADEISARELAITGVQNVIGEGFSEQLTIAQSLRSTNEAVSGIDSDVTELQTNVSGINSDVTVLQTYVSGIQDNVAALQTAFNTLSGNLKIGATEEINVPANDTYSGSYNYPISFADTSKSFVILGFADPQSQATLSLTLISSTYTGFSYSITNTDADPATVTIGYLAVKVG